MRDIYFLNEELGQYEMQLIVLNIISYQYIVHTRKLKDRVVSLKGSVYREEACIMMRLGSLLTLFAYFLCFMQGTDGKELPVSMSDVMERLVVLEKRLLIQEQKNVDLEGRLSEQKNLNKVPWETFKTCVLVTVKHKEILPNISEMTGIILY